MALPKGTFKGLARLLSPLSFWMAAGWFAYPYMILKIIEDAGETMDADEVWLFSKFMVVACVAAGIALAIHGFSGKDAPDERIKRLARKQVLCPYCGSQLADGVKECAGCHNIIPPVQ